MRISHRPERERARLRANHVGVLRQSGNLFDHLGVDANLRLAQALAGRGDRAVSARRRIRLVTDLGLSHRLRARPAELSGGELARAGLAVALCNAPDVLLADEPTGELDSTTERRLIELLRAQAERGVAVVVASHSPAVAGTADRVVSLRDGRVDS